MRLHKSHFLLIFILAVGLVLRLPLLNASFWLDEAAQALESLRPLSQQLQIVDDFQPPLIHILVHVLLLFSRQEWWLRFGVAVIPSLITIWATYQVGKRLFSIKVGALAAALLATSSFDIFYAQELRPYALPSMWAALSWFVIVGWLKEKEQKSFFSRQLIFFVVCSLAGWYSSYLYPFLFIAQVCFVLLAMPKLRSKILLSTGAVLIGFSVWLPMFFAQLRAGQNLRLELPGWEKIVGFDQVKSIILIGGKFLFGVSDLEVNKVFILAILFLGLLFAPLLWSSANALRINKKDLVQRQSVVLIVLWLFLPILLVWLVSFIVPILQPKRVLFCLPAFYLGVAYLIWQPWQYLASQRKLKTAFKALDLQLYTFSILAIFLFFSLNVAMTVRYYLQPKYQREDWRGMHQAILDRYPTNAVALFAFPEPFAPWRWYDDGSYPVITTGVLSTDSLNDVQNVRQVTHYHTILVFDYLRDLTDPQRKIEAQLQKDGYLEVDQITPKTGVGIVHVYQKK